MIFFFLLFSLCLGASSAIILSFFQVCLSPVGSVLLGFTAKAEQLSLNQQMA